MRELTKQAINQLQRETARQLVVADFDLIEELDAVAKRVAGISESDRRLINAPYELSGILFYPITVAKSLWLDEKLKEWDVDADFETALIILLLSLPLNSESLESVATYRDARKAANKLLKRLHCTTDDVARIIARCISNGNQSGGKASADDSAQENAANYGGMIACLLKEYGNTPEKWLYETPVELIAELMERYTNRLNAESDAARSSSAKGGKAVAPQWSQKMQGLKDFREKVNAIREIWSANDGE